MGKKQSSCGAQVARNGASMPEGKGSKTDVFHKQPFFLSMAVLVMAKALPLLVKSFSVIR